MEQLTYDKAFEEIPLAHASRCVYEPTNTTEVALLLSDNDNLYFRANFRIDQIGMFLGVCLCFLVKFCVCFIKKKGENMGYALGGIDSTFESIQNMVENEWFDSSNYVYTANKSVTCLHKDKKNCEEYIHLIWGETRYLGCGAELCPFLKLQNGTLIEDALFVVCHYWPSFDTDELPPYKQGSPCSNCPTYALFDFSFFFVCVCVCVFFFFF